MPRLKTILILFLAAGMLPWAAAQNPPAQNPPGQTPPAQQQPPAAAAPQAAAPTPDENAAISLRLSGADLLQVVSIIAAELKMNYVVDPQVKGTVTINTMGEVKRGDLLPLLQAILRVNGATAVQTGNLWRIVPSKEAQRLPVTPQVDARELPPDDRMMLNVIPLRYVSAADMGKILSTYLSDAGSMVVHEAGNLLLILDTSRSLKRLMDLLAIFDSDAFAGQRVRLFPVKNSSAKELVNDLQSVFAAYALSEKSALRFVPIERINSLLVVSPNPASFKDVEKWLAQLDQATRTAGIRNYVYKVENGVAEDIAAVLGRLYGGASYVEQPAGTRSRGGTAGAAPQAPTAPAPTRLVGTPLAAGEGAQPTVRFVPDTVNNMIVVQSTPPEWEEIRATLKELDIIPRQVLIEAQIFEVNLSGALSMGVTAFLQNRTNAERKPLASFDAFKAGLSVSAGTLIGQTRELLTFLNAQENRSRTRVISAPSILASDNQNARIQVGTEIPILTSVTTPLAGGGFPTATNTITNRDTGVILSVMPRINAGGLVTLSIQQEVSVPGPLGAGGSPTIQKRSVSTQVTVQDGEAIALGGIISETNLISKSRIPLLGDIPGLGLLFGNTSTSRQRTELIVLLTPHVIRDVAEAADMTEELKDKLKGLRKILRQAP